MIDILLSALLAIMTVFCFVVLILGIITVSIGISNTLKDKLGIDLMKKFKGGL